VLVQEAAGLGRLDLAAQTIEERCAERLLQILDVRADGGLRQSDRASGAREAALLVDATEDLDQAKVHGRNCSRAMAVGLPAPMAEISPPLPIDSVYTSDRQYLPFDWGTRPALPASA